MMNYNEGRIIELVVLQCVLVVTMNQREAQTSFTKQLSIVILNPDHFIYLSTHKQWGLMNPLQIQSLMNACGLHPTLGVNPSSLGCILNTCSMNFLNLIPCRGLVKYFLIMPSTGQYSIFISIDCNLSDTKIYLMLMHIVIFLLNPFRCSPGACNSGCPGIFMC